MNTTRQSVYEVYSMYYISNVTMLLPRPDTRDGRRGGLTIFTTPSLKPLCRKDGTNSSAHLGWLVADITAHGLINR